jgi:hypothetical protein
MAKRVTIRSNPLDTLVPNPKPDQPGKPPAAAKAQSARPAADSARTTAPQNQLKAKDSHIPMLATPVAQPPSPADLSSRLQSLEKQNEYIMWLVGGAILLMFLL